jgi:pimeloyl-ACP methyl ester carboxylesterase
MPGITNVLLLPGLAGSQLSLVGLPPDQGLVWVNALAMAQGAIARLQLDPTGTMPGPIAAGSQLYAPQPDPTYYMPLFRYLTKAGYTVWAAGYDWRQSMELAAGLLLPRVNRFFGDAPFAIVAHSMGGLVARLLYALLNTAGQAARVQRLICIGTPHFGSWATHQIFWRAYLAYKALQFAAGLAFPNGLTGSALVLDAVCATWPSFYEVMPFQLNSWIAAQFASQIPYIYELANYAGGNPYLTAQWLGYAPTIQATIQGSLPLALMAEIDGTGLETALALATTGSFLALPTYQRTMLGDSVVPAASSQLPGLPFYATVKGTAHADLPCDSRVQALVGEVLAQGPVAQQQPAAAAAMPSPPAEAVSAA